MIALDVFGMTCSGCETAVRRAIASLDPTATVSASAARNRVDADTALTAEQAIAAIEAAGYEATVANAG